MARDSKSPLYKYAFLAAPIVIALVCITDSRGNQGIDCNSPGLAKYKDELRNPEPRPAVKRVAAIWKRFQEEGFSKNRTVTLDEVEPEIRYLRRHIDTAMADTPGNNLAELLSILDEELKKFETAKQNRVVTLVLIKVFFNVAMSRRLKGGDTHPSTIENIRNEISIVANKSDTQIREDRRTRTFIRALMDDHLEWHFVGEVSIKSLNDALARGISPNLFSHTWVHDDDGLATPSAGAEHDEHHRFGQASFWRLWAKQEYDNDSSALYNRLTELRESFRSFCTDKAYYSIEGAEALWAFHFRAGPYHHTAIGLPPTEMFYIFQNQSSFKQSDTYRVTLARVQDDFKEALKLGDPTSVEAVNHQLEQGRQLIQQWLESPMFPQ